jgi:hypothetical protein
MFTEEIDMAQAKIYNHKKIIKPTPFIVIVMAHQRIFLSNLILTMSGIYSPNHAGTSYFILTLHTLSKNM